MANAKKIIADKLASDFEEYKNSSTSEDIIRFYWIKKRSVLDQSVVDLDMRTYLQNLIRLCGEAYPIKDTKLRFLTYAAQKLNVSAYTKTLTIETENGLLKSPYVFEITKNKKPNMVKMIAEQGFEILNNKTEFSEQEANMNLADDKISFFETKNKFSKFDQNLKPIFDEIISEIKKYKASL